MFYGLCNKVPNLGTEHMAASICGLDVCLCMPENDFCFLKFMLARKVISLMLVDHLGLAILI